MDLYSQGYERSYTVNSSILNAIEPHLKDFQQLLLDPPKVKTMKRCQIKQSTLQPWTNELSSVYMSIHFVTVDDNFLFTTEKCNTDDRWRSGAATGERPPSCGPAGGCPAADQWSQYLPGPLQPFHHGRTTGKHSLIWLCLLSVCTWGLGLDGCFSFHAFVKAHFSWLCVSKLRQICTRLVMRVGSTDYIITPPGQRAVGLAYLEKDGIYFPLLL